MTAVVMLSRAALNKKKRFKAKPFADTAEIGRQAMECLPESGRILYEQTELTCKILGSRKLM